MTKQRMEERMEHVLEVWLANPLLPFTEIAEKAGISETTFYRYKANAEFMQEYGRRCKERFNGLQAKALEVLENKLDAEDWQATKYVLDGNDYAGKQKLEVSTTTINVTIDE